MLSVWQIVVLVVVQSVLRVDVGFSNSADDVVVSSIHDAGMVSAVI